MMLPDNDTPYPLLLEALMFCILILDNKLVLLIFNALPTVLFVNVKLFKSTFPLPFNIVTNALSNPKVLDPETLVTDKLGTVLRDICNELFKLLLKFKLLNNALLLILLLDNIKPFNLLLVALIFCILTPDNILLLIFNALPLKLPESVNVSKDTKPAIGIFKNILSTADVLDPNILITDNPDTTPVVNCKLPLKLLLKFKLLSNTLLLILLLDNIIPYPLLLSAVIFCILTPDNILLLILNALPLRLPESVNVSNEI